MDMGFDHAAWPHELGDSAGESAGFDWHGLRARFLAAQACRGEFGPDRAAPATGGSFDAAAAAALAGYGAGYGESTPGINPIGLADGKGDRATAEMTRGQQGPAIEGDND